MRRFILVGVLLAVAVGAQASKTRLRLERVDASSFGDDGTLRVFASVVELEGNIDDGRAAPMFTLKLDGKSVGKPIKMQPFQAANQPLDLVLVVETSALYGPQLAATVPIPLPPSPPGKKSKIKSKTVKTPPKASKRGSAAAAPPPPAGGQPLDKVKDALHALLDALTPKTRVLLIDYGGDFNSLPFRPAGALGDALDELSPDTESGDLALVKAVDEALRQLARPRPDGAAARRLIVVISDGLNSQMERRTFKSLGDTAARAHVPIHTIGFSPTDDRGPLLNLGEISKRSNGTFRWARTVEDLKTQIDTLADEVNKQYVLTFKLETRSLEGKKLQLACDDLNSNPLVYDSSGGSFGFVTATRPLIPLWLWLVAGALLLGGAVALIAARARRPKKPMKFSPYKSGAAPTQPAQPVAPAPTAQRPVPVQPRAQPAAGPVAPGRAMLIVVSGALAGTRLAVGAQPILIGKGSLTGPSAPPSSGGGPAQLQISDDPTVSTRHAEVVARGGQVLVTDLGSTNGTFVNNQRVQRHVLQDGDLLRCGNTQLKMRVE